MEESKEDVKRVLEEVEAVKTILDDFSKAFFRVFNDIKTSIIELKNMTNFMKQTLDGLNVLLAKTDEILISVKRFEVLISSRTEGTVSPSMPPAQAPAPTLTEGALTVRSFSVRVSSAFSPVVEALERSRSAEEVARALEDVRDQLQSRVHGPFFYEISQLIKQLKSLGAVKLDMKTTEEIMSKLEEWSERIKK